MQKNLHFSVTFLYLCRRYNRKTIFLVYLIKKKQISMKNLNTYSIFTAPMGMYPSADDADYGTGKGMFNSNRDDDIG